MNIVKSLGLMALSTLVVSAFTSCEEHNPFSEKELFQQEYSKNFFKTYGNFPANQSWDFSEMPRTCTTDPSVFDLGWNSANSSATRAITPSNITVKKLSGDNWYSVDKTTQAWALEHLVEGRNNTLEGHPFSMVFPDNGDNMFAIIPIFKGQACITWQLCLSDGTNEKVLWEPWPLDPNNTTKDHNGVTEPSSHTSDIQYYENGAWNNVHFAENLENKSTCNLQSRPIIVSGVTGEFYLYLKTTYIQDNNDWVDGNGAKQEGHGYGNVGDIQSSINGCMSALTCAAPANINNYKTMLGIDKDIKNVMVIGCEDHQEGTVDWDMNDIVFLFIGLPELPTKREVTKSKRYLIEDLGTTVDFDFNDVVVDVTQTSLIDITNNTEVVYTQEAIIKHLCGTVPFNVYFVDGDGDHNWSTAFNYGNDIQGVVQGLNEECKGDDGSYTYKLVYSKNASGLSGQVTENPFWNPETNNIRIDVKDNGTLYGESWVKGEGADRIRTASFEKPGRATAPYIIAVPTTVMWTSESTNFPIDKVSQYNQ